MKITTYPETIPYEYTGLEEDTDGALSCVFTAQSIDVPIGFGHLETVTVPEEDLSDLPVNFPQGPAKLAVEAHHITPENA